MAITSQVSTYFFLSDKIINNSDKFRTKSLSYSKSKFNFMPSLFYTFYFILENMATNVRKFR